ncbi:MAG: alpha/beta fold hydrolase [Lautropia sp.]
MHFDVDGTDAYAYTGGRPPAGDRPVVVFIHGAQLDHSVWILQSRYLAHHDHDVLALDLPGHGRSGGAPLRTIGALADWTLAAVGQALRSLGTRAMPPVVLVGHSMGSLIALEATRDAPAWLAGIVLVSTAVPMKVSDALLSAAADDEPRALDMINAWSNAGLTHPPGAPGPGFSIFNQNRRLMERQRPGVLATDFGACNAYADGLDRARACRLPVLLVSGAADQMTPPRASRALADALARSHGVVVPGAGHNLMAERPDALLDALLRWLPGVVGAGADDASARG